MSVYNSENTLEKAVESVLSQSHKNFEFLIMDDGSKDTSLSKLKKLEKKDKRIKIFTNPTNLGLTKSLNVLLEHSGYNLIARQDADDISFSNRAERQLEFMFRNNLDAVYSRAIRNDNLKLLPRYSYYFPDRLVIRFKNPFIHGTLLAKKEVIQSVGNYDEKIAYAQDFKLAKDLLDSNFKVKTIKEPLYKINMSENISNLKKKEQQHYANLIKRGKL